MKSALVGYTGFVGGNLASSHDFDLLYNSKNIESAYGQKPDLVVYAGVRAEKFLANRNPQGDRATILQAFENLKKISPQEVVLISTIDVYRDPKGKDENSEMESDGLHPYGKNRLELEELVRKEFDCLIVRLPALFGKGIKKNFIYDALTLVPSMLTEAKYRELSERSELVRDGYHSSVNGFYTLDVPDENYQRKLKSFFEKNDWNSLFFTDSRNKYQFYDLGNLWNDICIALEHDLEVINLTSEPVSASEVYEYCFDKPFVNITASEPITYDLRSVHAEVFGGESGYCYTRENVLDDLKRFVQGYAV